MGLATLHAWRTDAERLAAGCAGVVRWACGAILCAMGEQRDELLSEAAVATSTKVERKLKEPKMFKVLLLNDDYTTMEFVVFVLQSIFQRPNPEAVQIMLHVHKNGKGVAGVYPHEIAETRVAQVEALAREFEFPLRCCLEEA
jgi:ATP-dependent Clp protease adaptor protein ClpS